MRGSVELDDGLANRVGMPSTYDELTRLQRVAGVIAAAPDISKIVGDLFRQSGRELVSIVKVLPAALASYMISKTVLNYTNVVKPDGFPEPWQDDDGAQFDLKHAERALTDFKARRQS